MSIPRSMDYTYASKTASDVEKALKTDPLAAAEEITGKSYKDDDETSLLGLLMDLDHQKAKRAILSEQDDTYSSMPWWHFLRIIEEEGFIIESHTPYFHKSRLRQLHTLVAVHPDGILLLANSYAWEGGQEIVNSAGMYYNIVFTSDDDYYKFVSSGGFRSIDESEDEFVWVGSHDVREGFRFSLDRLRATGEFLNPWVEKGYVSPNLDLNAKSDFDTINFGDTYYEHVLKTFEDVPVAYELIASSFVS